MVFLVFLLKKRAGLGFVLPSVFFVSGENVELLFFCFFVTVVKPSLSWDGALLRHTSPNTVRTPVHRAVMEVFDSLVCSMIKSLPKVEG